jgi:membrane protease YdiL (CAAX protease family)
LYVVIGLLSGIGSILIFRRICQGQWEQIFWTSFLVVIAAFYLSFAAYFGASIHAWQTELVGVAGFLVCAVGGLFSRPAIAVGYVMHGLWNPIPLSVRLVACGPVNNGNSTGLRYLLFNVRFYCRLLPHHK